MGRLHALMIVCAWTVPVLFAYFLAVRSDDDNIPLQCPQGSTLSYASGERAPICHIGSGDRMQLVDPIPQLLSADQLRLAQLVEARTLWRRQRFFGLLWLPGAVVGAVCFWFIP